MKGIIYKYTSPSGKIYIGQTIDEDKRRSDFLNINVRYSGPKIEAARRKYGPENFAYKVIFSVTSEIKDEIRNILNEKEKEYIKLFDSVNNGYNIDEGGAYIDSEHVKPVSEETRKKQSDIMKKRWDEGFKPVLTELSIQSIKDKLSVPVLQYTMEGKFLAEWKSAKEAGTILGVSPSLITKSCRRQNKCCRAWIFVYKNDYPDVPEEIDPSLIAEKYKKDPNRYKNGKCRIVYQFDMDRNLIQTFSSVKEAASILGYNKTTLGRRCKDNIPLDSHIYSYYERF